MKKLLLVGTALTVLFGGSAELLTSDGQLILRRHRRPQLQLDRLLHRRQPRRCLGKRKRERQLLGLSASSDRSGFIGGRPSRGQLTNSATLFLARMDFDWTSLDATGEWPFVPGVGTLQGIGQNTRWISTWPPGSCSASNWRAPLWQGGGAWGRQ